MTTEAPPLQGLPGMSAPQGGAYFEAKKGEVAELRQLLRTVNSGNDLQRKREAIKKVIAYMTLGIDVSRLFSEMVICVETKDLVVKKMVYLYLVKYAQEHADLALMCINNCKLTRRNLLLII